MFHLNAVKIQVQNYIAYLKFGLADMTWTKEKITDDVSVISTQKHIRNSETAREHLFIQVDI